MKKGNSETSTGWFGWSGRLYEENYFSAEDRSVFCPKTDLGNGSEELNEWRFKQNTFAGNSWGLYKATAWNDRTWLIHNGENIYANYTSVPVSSEFIFLADSFSRYSDETLGKNRNSSVYTNGQWGKIWTIHNPLKKANAAYLDGHISSTSVSQWREYMTPSVVFAFQ